MAFFRIRLGSPDDHPFLGEMLFEAAYRWLDQERPSLETGWYGAPRFGVSAGRLGMDGDAAVIACNEDDLQVGAAWYRFLGDRTAFLWLYLIPNSRIGNCGSAR